MLLKFKIEPENDQEISDEDIIKYNDKLQFQVTRLNHNFENYL